MQHAAWVADWTTSLVAEKAAAARWEGAPVVDISDRFMDVISRFEEVADAVTPHDAYRQLDEASMQVFWRTWPGISSWAGSLWRLLNEELMDPAVPSHHPDSDEVGGSG
jgi:hypothetical protein